MDQTIAIKAAGLGKAYRIWQAPADRLISPILHNLARWTPANVQEKLHRRAANGYNDFAALSDINFEINRGEAVAIIGRNGAGKSTLLQLIAGTLQPSAGSIEVNGRVAALLELGAGFNPEFTGRENVFLSGAVLGISKAEMERRFEDVVAFADIGDFIEQPVKTYSSGMMMRLAFAVNTCVDPDILIVDEALSVGDAPFQSKCFRRLRQLTDRGVSLLFVSHDLSTVRSICSRALWLKNGRAEMWGDAKAVAKEYEKFCWQEQGVVLGESSPTRTSEQSSKSPSSQTSRHELGSVEARLAQSPAPDVGCDRFGTGKIYIRKMALLDQAQEYRRDFAFNESVSLCLQLEARADFSGLVRLGTRIKSVKQDFLLTVSDLQSSLPLHLQSGDTAIVSYDFPLPLTEGHYSFLVALFEVTPLTETNPAVYDFSNSTIFDSLDQVCPFFVRPHSPIPAVGPVHLDRKLHLHNQPV